MTNAAYTPPPFPCSIVVVKTTGQLGKTFKFEKKDWCVLGANEDCDIIVPFSGVAQLQALIHVKRNGVFLQGIDKQLPVRHPRLQKLLRNEEEVLLLPGDIFFLGERKFLIDYNAVSATADSASNNTSHAQDQNDLTAENPRIATPRSSRAQKRRRKSSLVVGEFDEKYVSPKKGSEKLLSKTQLARLSNCDSGIRPPSESNHNRTDPKSSSQQETLEDHSQGSEDSSSSSSSDESTVVCDLQERISRSIDFSAIEDAPVRQLNGRQPDTQYLAQSGSFRKVSSRGRRDIVFARLSKGLSATPRRGERIAFLGTNDNIVQKVSGYSQFEEANVLTGKENVPQLCSEVQKSSKSADGDQDVEINRIRSPLSDRGEIENQTVPVSNQGQTPRQKTRLWNASMEKSSLQTPRGRAVAFASDIELAAGAHYSPFRPKSVVYQPKNTSKSKKKSQSGKPIDTARTDKFQGHFPVTPPHHKPTQIHPMKNTDQASAPTTGLDRSGASLYTKGVSRGASGSSAQPVLEYEDDSDPPTPSSTDEELESNAQQVPGTSPMARVGGALAAFLSRLSGTLESEDENDSSPETDEASSYKTLSFTKSQEKSSKQSFHSSEPVMSSSEMKELSGTISPGRRKAFVSQVESAAPAMRQAMQPLSDESPDKTPCSSLERVEVEETGRDVLAKVEDGSTDPAKLVEEVAETCRSGSTDLVTSQEEGIVQQNPLSTRSLQAAECGQTSFDASENLLWATGETLSDPENDEEFGDRSTSPEEYSDRSIDSADLEIEQIFPSSVNQTDLRSEESEGDEIDYGDEDDDASRESSDREIAAVVIEGDEDDIHDFPICSDGHSYDDSYNSEDGHNHARNPEAQSLEFESPGESKNSAEATEIPHCIPIQGSPDAGSEPQEREEASLSTKEPVREIMESSIASDSPAKIRIRTEVEEVAEVIIVDETDDEEGDMSKTKQASIPNETIMLEDKPTQLSTARKELFRLKKDELKARLVAHGLDASGLKKDLVERLALHIVEEINPGIEEKSKENSNTPLRQKIKRKNLAITSPASPHARETPGVPQAPPNSEEDDSIAQETRSVVRRSARKKRTQSPLVINLETPSPTDKPQSEPESQSEDEADAGPDLSSYRRRTVKELRQFLKKRGLDIQPKMRKEELIQHLVSLSIGSDGNLTANESEAPPSAEESKLQSGEAEPPLSAALKSLQRMTVTQLRAHLKNRGQCQAGTKKTLLERLSSKSEERRTRSGRAVDATACPSCQTGKVCEANSKR